MNVVFSLIMCCACVSMAVGSSGSHSDDSSPVCSPYSKQSEVVLTVSEPSGTPKREVVVGEKSWQNSDEHKHPLTGDVWKKEKPTYTVNEEGIHEIAFPETIFSKYGNDVVSLRPIKIQIDSKVANWERFQEQTEQLKEALSDDTPTRVLALVDAMCLAATTKLTYGKRELLETCKELDRLQEYLRLLSLRGAKDDVGESYYRLFCSLSCICSEFVVFNNKAVLPENLYIAGLYIRLGSKKPEEYSCLEKYGPSNKNVIEEINSNGGIDSSDSTSFLAWGIKKALEDKKTFDLLPGFLKDMLRTP